MNNSKHLKTNILHDSRQNKLILNNSTCSISKMQKENILQNNFLSPTNKTFKLKQHNRDIRKICLTQTKQNEYLFVIQQPKNTSKNGKYEHKIGQIDELLLKFKTKYAIIQEKYLILQNKKQKPVVSRQNETDAKLNFRKQQFSCQTMGLKQNNSSKLTTSSNNVLKQKLLKKTKLEARQQQLSIDRRRHSQGILQIKAPINIKLCSTIHSITEKQFLLPLQKIKKSNQVGHISKLQFIKDVQSQDEFDKNNMQQSVVISKLSDMINVLNLSPK